MKKTNLLEELRCLKSRVGSMACLGCGHESRCSTGGCAIIREAINVIETDDPDRTNRIYGTAIQKWGAQAQIDKTFEEMGEVQVELCRMLFGRGDKAHLAEEIADVRIMLEQMERLFAIESEVLDRRREKLDRLAKRIGMEVME